MNLFPFNSFSDFFTGDRIVTCPMCAHHHRESKLPPVKYCVIDHGDDCEGLMDRRTFGSTRIPHLHKTCVNCGYVWLEHTAEDQS